MRVQPRDPSPTALVRRGHHPALVLGLVYVTASLVCSGYYLSHLETAFWNDLWWTNYSVNAHQALLVDLFNFELASHAIGSFNLLAPSSRVDKSYASAVASTSFSPTYVRELILSELTSVEYAVKNLRTLRGQQSMWMAAQYCWVDLSREFEVAHTVARQHRCMQRYRTNGAMYMETVLRNLNWKDFVNNYGGNGGMFTVAIQNWLEQIPSGIAWLNVTAQARETTTVAQEMAHWSIHGITSFQLQWQNLWLTGISETVTLENSLGLQQDIVLKYVPRIFQAWTSIIMYWLPYDDLQVMLNSNRSMIHSADNAFLESPAVDFEIIFGLQDNENNIIDRPDAFRRSVGPFNSIDMFVLPVPTTVLNLLHKFDSVLFEMLKVEMDDIIDIQLLPTPPPWDSSIYLWYGGNPMCLEGSPLPFVQDSFSFGDSCAIQAPFAVVSSKYSSIFAALATRGDFSSATVCSMSNTPVDACVTTMQAISRSIVLLDSVAEAMSGHMNAAKLAIQSIDVSIMQFASSVNDSNIQLLQYSLFQASTWAFFDWVMLYDWAVGKREVVSFEGDIASLVLISAVDSPISFISSTPTVKNSSKILYYLVVYVTFILAFVVALCFVYAMIYHGHVHGPNLIWFNRAVGSMWIGRPLVFLRGITAAVLLSTSDLQPIHMGGYARFELQPLSLLGTLVVAGEATWLLYVVHDFLTVLLHDLTSVYGPLSCFLAWITLAMVDISWPVRPVAMLNRQCSSQDMDVIISCSSGLLRIGSLQRFGLVFVVQGLALVVSIVLTLLYKRLRPSKHRPLDRHVLGIADAFFDSLHDSPENAWSMDKMSCVMVGLLSIHWHDKRYLFDVKLWVLERDKLSTRSYSLFHLQQSGLFGENSIPTRLVGDIPSKSTRFKTIIHAVLVSWGIIFVMLAILGSVSYLEESQTDLANDMFWAAFNMTGAHAFAATWFNEQLLFGLSKAEFDMSSDYIVQEGMFDKSTASIPSASNFGSRIHYNELTSLENAVSGLRSTDSCSVPWIFTSYCFVDFQQRWEMATTDARQQRCHALVSNGALFLESVLRNINYNNFHGCWGAEYENGIAHELRRSQNGRIWLAEIEANVVASLLDEVAVWKFHRIEYFKTQWQNYKSIGLVNTYSITSALSLSYEFPLQNQISQFRLDKQTTFKMYWALANDFIAITTNNSGIGGLSLIRSSPTYAFANITLQTTMIHNGTLSAPFSAAYTLMTTNVLGPFGAVDMYYIACPNEALDAVREIYHALRQTRYGNNSSQYAFDQISFGWPVYPAPKIWTDLNFISLGGSPLCPEYPFASSLPIAAGFTILTSWEFKCFAAATSTFMNPSREAMVTSMILANLSSASSSSMDATCAQAYSAQMPCTLFLQQASSFVTTYTPPKVLDRLMIQSANATRAIHTLNIEFMQYGIIDSTSPLTLYHTNVLDPSQLEFAFFAWLYLVDWVLGFREAVTFQGDVGSLNLLTDYLNPVFHQVNDSENHLTLSLYLRNATLYVTYAMILLTSFVLLYILLCRGHVEVLNLFLLERMGAIVWIGRPLLFVRSLAAIALLATSSLELHTTGYLSYFAAVDRPLLVTLLASNEVTWLVAIVNDIAIVFTNEFAFEYSGWDSLLVCAVSALLSAAAPITHSASIDKQCILTQMDFQVECTSANITIGHISRLYTLVAIVVGSNVVMYGCCRLWLRQQASAAIPVASIFLYGSGKFMLRKAKWMCHGVYYIDRMSAAVNGILTISRGNTIFCMDVKLWRLFAVEFPDPTPHDTPEVQTQLARYKISTFPLPQSQEDLI
ncbi:Aste57867_19725 [Aphanomyces stellatus]|uniref:Aste57867_19725 protein n=1 Tax=Aphanomyces stellatus TaxID=120398 RepID=A0A485LDR7_9STRA|nr:hypothetical protein As57867_019660 [Aphanomyces stellatus]VFT96423.1 Aste57867_19725 [Aphanomyces stellatus]